MLKVTLLFFHLQRATLDLNLRHVNLEKKNTHDMHSRKSREKDRDLRNLKKTEMYLRVAEDTLSHTQLIYDKVRQQVSSQNNDGTICISQTPALGQDWAVWSEIN